MPFADYVRAAVLRAARARARPVAAIPGSGHARARSTTCSRSAASCSRRRSSRPRRSPRWRASSSPGLVGVLPGLRPVRAARLGPRRRSSRREAPATGRARGPRRARSATSAAAARSSGSTPRPGVACACLTTASSATGRRRRGRGSRTPSCESSGCGRSGSSREPDPPQTGPGLVWDAPGRPPSRQPSSAASVASHDLRPGAGGSLYDSSSSANSGRTSSSKVARSQLATTHGVIAVTVAVRGTCIVSATSPNDSPGRRIEWFPERPARRRRPPRGGRRSDRRRRPRTGSCARRHLLAGHAAGEPGERLAGEARRAGRRARARSPRPGRAVGSPGYRSRAPAMGPPLGEPALAGSPREGRGERGC